MRKKIQEQSNCYQFFDENAEQVSKEFSLQWDFFFGAEEVLNCASLEYVILFGGQVLVQLFMLI